STGGCRTWIRSSGARRTCRSTVSIALSASSAFSSEAVCASVGGPRPSALAGDDVALHAAARKQRALGRYASGIDSGPADLAGQAAVLDLRAPVPHHAQAGGLGLGGRRLRAAEDVDDVDRGRHLGERGIDALAQDLLAGKAGVHRHDAVPPAPER